MPTLFEFPPDWSSGREPVIEFDIQFSNFRDDYGGEQRTTAYGAVDIGAISQEVFEYRREYKYYFATYGDTNNNRIIQRLSQDNQFILPFWPEPIYNTAGVNHNTATFATWFGLAGNIPMASRLFKPRPYILQPPYFPLFGSPLPLYSGQEMWITRMDRGEPSVNAAARKISTWNYTIGPDQLAHTLDTAWPGSQNFTADQEQFFYSDVVLVSSVRAAAKTDNKILYEIGFQSV